MAGGGNERREGGREGGWLISNDPMRPVATAKARRRYSLLAAISFFTVLAEPSSGQSWTVTTAPSANWVALATSADGNTLSALVQGGEAVYISTNAGATWSLSSPANGGAVGSSIACSADGRILYFAGTTQIFCSTNSGATWNPTLSPFANWTSVACSANGGRLAGASALRRGAPSGILTSSDGGATWDSTTRPATAFLAVAVSADGTRLASERTDHVKSCRAFKQLPLP